MAPTADNRPSPTPEFDWRTEQGAQKRDQARFVAELERVLSLRGGSPAVRQAATRLRAGWEHLVRRIEGRWARSGDLWDRQIDAVDRLRAERAILEALVEYDEQRHRGDLDALLRATLRAIARSLPCDGALMILADIGGQPRQMASERRRGRFWPPAADRELAEQIAATARLGRRVSIEGRPVKSGPREHHRAAHWLGVGIAHEGNTYGAIVLGRPAGDEAFTEEQAEILERVARRLGESLTARVGAGVRPVLGTGPKPEGFEHLWGEAPAYRRAVALAERFALADSPIVIEGEMGTGRETLARAIHRRSSRADGPFIVFRGADLPEEVVARGLFGLGGVSPDGHPIDSPGDLELADHGVLFIDDLGAFTAVLQVRLLRYLSEGIYERVGDRTPRRVDARLIIASRRDLEGEVARGNLRADLYYRLTAARATLPPLRERSGDIIELARRFAVAAGQGAGKRIEGIDMAAARVLTAAPFPGNVRQLEQVIERAVFLAAGSLVTAADLPSEITARTMASPPDGGIWVDEVTRAVRQAADAGQTGDWRSLRRARKQADSAVGAAFVQAVVKAAGRHAARAARHCGIHRAQWWRLWRAVQDAMPAAGRETPEPPRSRPETNQ